MRVCVCVLLRIAAYMDSSVMKLWVQVALEDGTWFSWFRLERSLLKLLWKTARCFPSLS